MLTALRIQNIVLIDKLSLEFHEGLCTLTGETGGGKSILLDALGLALGGRMEVSMIRVGEAQGTVSAVFEAGKTHPALEILKDAGLEPDETLVLRRVITADGRSKAFVNDQPVGVALLKQLGESLAEIHGQFETQSLLEPQTHRAALDEYAGLGKNLRALWASWKESESALQAMKDQTAQSKRDEDYLRRSLEDLDGLDPQVGDEQKLAGLKERLAHREKLLDALNTAHGAMASDNDPLAQAQRALERVQGLLGAEGQEALAALARAQAETQEALARIQAASADMEENSDSLEEIDDRLHDLRAQARKHGCTTDELPSMRDTLAERLKLIDHAGGMIEEKAREVEKARAAYIKEAEKTAIARRSAAKKLDQSVAKELAPLKLEKARFVTSLESLDEKDWSEHGMDRVRFLVATHPGAEPGPIAKIASGGEMARFMLALKVVLTGEAAAKTLIFDEVDSGIGGATADAVGERLARLARGRQVLVVTHSPQVAARADHHFIVQKQTGKKTVTDVMYLKDKAARREEIARMLAGAQITNEARAAAEKLMRKDAA